MDENTSTSRACGTALAPAADIVLAVSGRLLHERDDLRGGLLHGLGGYEARVGEDSGALFGAGPREPDHERHVDSDRTCRGNDSFGHLIAAGDAAEDVDQEPLDVRVRQHD